MYNTVRYKQFDLIVTVKSDGFSRNRYEVVTTAQQIDNTKRRRTWLIFQEFDSEKAAYEYGLQEARAWIDAQPVAG